MNARSRLRYHWNPLGYPSFVQSRLASAGCRHLRPPGPSFDSALERKWRSHFYRIWSCLRWWYSKTNRSSFRWKAPGLDGWSCRESRFADRTEIFSEEEYKRWWCLDSSWSCDALSAAYRHGNGSSGTHWLHIEGFTFNPGTALVNLIDFILRGTPSVLTSLIIRTVIRSQCDQLSNGCPANSIVRQRLLDDFEANLLTKSAC